MHGLLDRVVVKRADRRGRHAQPIRQRAQTVRRGNVMLIPIPTGAPTIYPRGRLRHYGDHDCSARPSPAALFAGLVDQLDPIRIRIADETQPRAALADAVRLALGLDALLLQASQRLVEVVDRDRNVPVGGAQLIAAAVVVERELELLLLAREAEEVVRRLQFAVADDVEVAAVLHPERLVEGTALLGIGDPVHRVQVTGHAPILGTWGPRAR